MNSSVIKQIPNTHWFIASSFTLCLPLLFFSHLHTALSGGAVSSLWTPWQILFAAHRGLVVQSVSLLFCLCTHVDCQRQVYEEKKTQFCLLVSQHVSSPKAGYVFITLTHRVRWPVWEKRKTWCKIGSSLSPSPPQLTWLINAYTIYKVHYRRTGLKKKGSQFKRCHQDLE